MPADHVGNDLFDVGWNGDVKRDSFGTAASLDDFPGNALRVVTAGPRHDNESRRGKLSGNRATNAPRSAGDERYAIGSHLFVTAPQALP
jgi:hypothetical protein